MLEELTSFIQPIVAEYGALGVFLATLLEEIIAPIPSPLVPLSAGFFLLPAGGSFLEITWGAIFMIALPVSFGITLGSLAVYSLGFMGGKPAIEKSKKLLGLGWKDLEKVEKRLTRGSGDELVLFALRVLPIVPGVAVSGFCGVVRYPVKTFAAVTFLGSLLRALALGVAGWYVGGAYASYSEVISRSEKYIFAALIFLAIIFMGRFYFMRRRRVPSKQRGMREED